MGSENNNLFWAGMAVGWLCGAVAATCAYLLVTVLREVGK